MPCGRCSPPADAKNVRITTEADSWLGFIQGDSARLEQVVCEPVVERGQVHARRWHRSCPAETRPGRRRDPGPRHRAGDVSRFLPYIFEPFRQADGSTTRVHGGLGLGLSIVKHLVEAHGGSVEAQSAGVGQGATFIARFPIDPACANAVTSAVAPRDSGACCRDAVTRQRARAGRRRR